jgi:hypothetical protein
MTIQTKAKSVRRWVMNFLLLNLFALSALAVQSAQKQEDDDLRRVWNKKFVEARNKNATAQSTRPSPAKSSSGRRTRGGKNAQTTVASNSPTAVSSSTEKLNGELIGITFWRLTEAQAKVGKNQPGLTVRGSDGRISQLTAERVTADTPFQPGQRVRIGIEIPREKNGYLYVIDREVYADGTMSEPYLIFPSQNTPPDGNRATAGKIIYVPAQGDPLPHFTIQRSRADQVSELLTIIVSPNPLDVQPGPPNNPTQLDPALVAQWEKQWGGRTERRETRGGAGAAWTAREKEAGEGKRKLLQGDPLPQTVYLVSGKVSGYTLANVPIRLAP